jgi:hypothetical protein
MTKLGKKPLNGPIIIKSAENEVNNFFSFFFYSDFLIFFENDKNNFGVFN